MITARLRFKAPRAGRSGRAVQGDPIAKLRVGAGELSSGALVGADPANLNETSYDSILRGYESTDAVGGCPSPQATEVLAIIDTSRALWRRLRRVVITPPTAAEPLGRTVYVP
jgi:hypothetical protein